MLENAEAVRRLTAFYFAENQRCTDGSLYAIRLFDSEGKAVAWRAYEAHVPVPVRSSASHFS
jgi:hypothetical protein